MLFDRMAKGKWRKELKNDLKDLRLKVLAVEGDKAQMTRDYKELQDTIESAAMLYEEYTAARNHLLQARELIVKLLESMRNSIASEVYQSLQQLIAELEQIYDECLIRRDDMDFLSTTQSLAKMVNEYMQNTDGMRAIMLRSELENVKAVLDDVTTWNAPDFLALAYYFMHEDKQKLHDVENEQRNQLVLKYFKEMFMDEIIGQCYRAGQEMQMRALLQKYIYG